MYFILSLLSCTKLSTIFNNQQVISVFVSYISALPIEIVNYNADTHSRYEEGEPGVAVMGNYT
jgi:hypothetical protein